MKEISIRASAVLFFVCSAVVLSAQQASTSVPRLVRVSGTFRPSSGQVVSPVESVTFSVYADEQGGTPLWSETQNVQVDQDGHYSALMGNRLSAGMPPELFAGGEARWLGLLFNRPGEAEQPRTLLVSVPYALKAADAETLGGKPASAYLLSPSGTASGTAEGAFPNVAMAPTAATASVAKVSSPSPRTSSGSVNYLGMFMNGADLGNSVAYQAGTKVGFNTTSPLDYLHVRFTNTTGAFTGYAVQNLGSTSTSYSGMLFFDQNGALGQFQGFNNGTHEYRINNIASGGSINFMLGGASKFYVASNGSIGIGTTTPAASLEVNGATRVDGTLSLQSGTAAAPALTFGTDATSGVYSSTAQAGGPSISITTGGTEQVRVTAGGLSASRIISTGDLDFADPGGTGSITQNGTPLVRSNASNGSLFVGLGSNGAFTSANNTAVGHNAMHGLTTGNSNTAIGDSALYSLTTGIWNVALGPFALESTTTNNENTGVGYNALASNQTGAQSTAVGAFALQHSTASALTAIGDSALAANTSGIENTAVGFQALTANTSALGNTAVGYRALQANDVTTGNTAVGDQALASMNNTNSIGTGANTAVGYMAANKSQAISNTAVGYQALLNAAGGYNTALGTEALQANTTGQQNTAVGLYGLGQQTTGSSNIGIGYHAGDNLTTGSNNIDIGNEGLSTDSSIIRIGSYTLGNGRAYITGIRNVQTLGSSYANVIVDENGQLGTIQSSRTVKRDIRDLGDTSDAFMGLRPVRFRYKVQGPDGPERYGLIAEEVEQVAPELVIHKPSGDIESVYYDQVNIMLLNEVQKQHRTIEAQEQALQAQSDAIRRLESRLAELENRQK